MSIRMQRAAMALGTLALAGVLVTSSSVVHAQETADVGFTGVAAQFAKDLRDAEAELAALRQQAEAEVLPLSKELTELQKELIAVQGELSQVSSDLNQGAVALSNLSKEIDTRSAAATRLTNLFSEYGRNFESRLHIAEIQRYRTAIEEARLAPENTNLTPAEIYDAQSKVVDLSLDRLFELGGGTMFDGTAIDANGIVREGRFALFGPTALFRSIDGAVVGTAMLRIGSLEPNVAEFGLPEDRAAADDLVAKGSGSLPLDASLGNAAKVEATKETLLEHIGNGGPIMYPLLGMGALALLVALIKWIHLLFVRGVSRRKFAGLLDAVAEGNEDSAKRRAKELKGPGGEMLRRGVDTMRRSRDLMEEVMYERVLVTKTRVQSLLPFIAICAAAAPLLGLLGTVTGIINTFAQITIYGSGDVKQLSGGISEALITTKFGLIVAIPSLLLHAYLSRKARGVITQMEASAVKFANEVAKSDEFGETSPARRFAATAPTVSTPDHEFVRGQVNAILTDMLGPLANDAQIAGLQGGTAGTSNG